MNIMSVLLHLVERQSQNVIEDFGFLMLQHKLKNKVSKKVKNKLRPTKQLLKGINHKT